MGDNLRDEILRSGRRLAAPILSYPGAVLTGCTVRGLVTDAAAQVAAQDALHERFGMPVLLSPMGLGVEAEAFGATVGLSDGEVPTVTDEHRRLLRGGTGLRRGLTDAVQEPRVRSRSV